MGHRCFQVTRKSGTWTRKRVCFIYQSFIPAFFFSPLTDAEDQFLLNCALFVVLGTAGMRNRGESIPHAIQHRSHISLV